MRLAKIKPAFFQHRSSSKASSRSIFSSAHRGEDQNAASYGAGWDGGGGAVRIGVWWDFENCNVPYGMDAHRVGINIVAGLRSSGFKGPVTISGYGDMLQLSRIVQENLSATGIRLHHVPSGGKESESSDRALLMDLILWTIENPPPAHLFLISGDRDFSTALHKLRMRNYNVLLACPAGAYISPSLLGAASRVWYWNSLVRGEALVAATSWSIDGPAPRPVLPPVMKPPPSPPPQSDKSSCHQHKIPYFSAPPISCPPIPPPFSCSSPSTSSSTGGFSLPSLPPDAAPVLSPYSVASPNFSSVSSAALSPPLPARPSSQPTTPTIKVLEITSSKTGKTVTKSADKTTKIENVAELLCRLEAILKAHPRGLWLGDLQTQMLSRKIVFDGDFYGHKKLVPYLLTLPRLARVERHLMKDNKTWSYLFFPSAASASDINSSKRADYPMEVISQLNDVFRQHTKGIWLPELHAQLVARNIYLDTNFYGHGKIVPFLLSLPEMVKIERRFVSDRWSYIFFWNEEGSRKLELTRTVYRKPLPVKAGVVIAASKPEVQAVEAALIDKVDGNKALEKSPRKAGKPATWEQERPVQDQISEEADSSRTAVEKLDSVPHDEIHASATNDDALVAVEEQTVSLYSRVSRSVLGFFQKIYRKCLWPREKAEGSSRDVESESFPLLESPMQQEPPPAQSPCKVHFKERLVRRTRRPQKRRKGPRVTPAAVSEQDALVLFQVGQDNRVEATILETVEQQALAADTTASSVHVTSAYNYDEDRLLENEVMVSIDQDSKEIVDASDTQAEVIYLESEDTVETAGNNDRGDALVDYNVVESLELRREEEAGIVVNEGHSESASNEQISPTGDTIADLRPVNFSDFVFRDQTSDHQKLEDKATTSELSSMSAVEGLGEGSHCSDVEERTIDTDRVLKLFQSFAKDTGATRAPTPADDLANKVLDLLEKSIQFDPPVQELTSEVHSDNNEKDSRMGKPEAKVDMLGFSDSSKVEGLVPSGVNLVATPPKPKRQHKKKSPPELLSPNESQAPDLRHTNADQDAPVLPKTTKKKPRTKTVTDLGAQKEAKETSSTEQPRDLSEAKTPKRSPKKAKGEAASRVSNKKNAEVVKLPEDDLKGPQLKVISSFDSLQGAFVQVEGDSTKKGKRKVTAKTF